MRMHPAQVRHLNRTGFSPRKMVAKVRKEPCCSERKFTIILGCTWLNGSLVGNPRGSGPGTRMDGPQRIL